MKRYALIQILSVFLLALLTAGLGLYLAPRLEGLLALKEINWSVGPQKAPHSIFAEQRQLEREYESALAGDITTTLEKMTGPDTVYAVVRAPIDLVQETEYVTPQIQVRSAYGQVQRLSVTVLIDGEKSQNKAGRTAHHPRSRSEMKNYTEMVKSVVGFDARRGDKVNIQNVSFAPEKGRIMGISRRVWAGGVAFILFSALIIGLIAGVLFPMMRRIVRGAGDRGTGHKSPLIKKVLTLCQKYPDQSGAVIRGWLKSPAIRKNGRSYTPAERAGILVLALGPTTGKKMGNCLPAVEAQNLKKIISRLGRLEAPDIQEALTRFMRDFYAPSYLKGGPEAAQEIVTDTPQEAAKEPVSWADICGLSDDKIRTLLKHLDANVLAMAIKSEQAETQNIFARHIAPIVWANLKNRFSTLSNGDTDRAQKIIIQTAQELHLFG